MVGAENTLLATSSHAHLPLAYCVFRRHLTWRVSVHCVMDEVASTGTPCGG